MAVVSALVMINSAKISAPTSELSAPPINQPERTAYYTTAVDLFLDYRKNEVAMDAAIGGSMIEITGHIESIDKDAAGLPVIVFDIGMDFNHAFAHLLATQEEKAIALKSGEDIDLLCDKSMRSMGDPMLFGCTIIR